MEPRTDLSAADRRLATLFPEEHAGHRRNRLWLVGTLVVVVALVVALLAGDAFGSSGPGYRTGTATRRTVETTLRGVASIEPVTQSMVAFPVAGTVAAVAVAPGQAVTLGQTLATLDAQQLQATLHQKQLALAQSQLDLSDALGGTVSGPASSGGGNGSNRSAATAALETGAPRIVLTAAPVGGASSLAAAQQAVVDAQRQVDQALAAAGAAQSAAQTTCAAAGVASGPPTTTSTSTTTTTTPSGADLAACQAALADLLTAQRAVAAAQRTLTAAEHALDALLAQQGNGSSSSSASRSGGATSSGRTATSSGPSAADLASYEQAVDRASAAVAVAEQAVSQGTIVSPIAGTVAAVHLTVGESVTAASTTENVVVTGPGGYEVSTNLTVAEVPKIALGDPASVMPDGAHRAYPGKVVSISALPSAVTTSATDYLVVVGLDDPNAPLTNGDLGTVTIVTKRVAHALAVPTSAITVIGTRHVVQVVASGGTPETVGVRVGAVGADWTQVTSGVQAGDRVVLADLSTPLPGSATSSTNGTTGTAANRIQGLFRGAGLGAGGGAGGFRGFAGSGAGGGAGR